MKILITASGGGHFSPALSVIEELPKDIEYLFVGRKYSLEGDEAVSLEYQTAKELGFPFRAISAGRLQRVVTKHTVPSLLKFPIGIIQALTVLNEYKPDVVVSFGGYVSVPVVFAASLLRIPIVIHEQTLEGGLANKISSFFAQKICISWESSWKFFPKKKIVFTGNPVRKEILETKHLSLSLKNKNYPTIYITGGSLGSHQINKFVEGCIQNLLKSYIVIHQTGDAKEFDDFNRLSKLRESFNSELKKKYFLKKFVRPDEVGLLLKEADLIVSRSGMSTVTELLYMEKPCLLIPLPVSQNNEQEKNALFLKDVGIAEILHQNKATSQDFFEKISLVMKELKKYHPRHSQDLYIRKDAAERIIQVIQTVYFQKKDDTK